MLKNALATGCKNCDTFAEFIRMAIEQGGKTINYFNKHFFLTLTVISAV